MTAAEKFFAEHPGGYIRGCPHEWGYFEEKHPRCMEISCFGKCWAREVPEEKEVRDK
jgi:hypothetical protein